MYILDLLKIKVYMIYLFLFFSFLFCLSLMAVYAQAKEITPLSLLFYQLSIQDSFFQVSYYCTRRFHPPLYVLFSLIIKITILFITLFSFSLTIILWTILSSSSTLFLLFVSISQWNASNQPITKTNICDHFIFKKSICKQRPNSKP